jgi:hypothetical protein
MQVCSNRLVYQKVYEGKLEACQIGKCGIRIPEPSVHKYPDAIKVHPEAQYGLRHS